MLTELRVRDLAVIRDVTLPLRRGLNVLTGETGAGKSMLVDALALLLGERASADLIRPGADRAVVEAAFDVAGVTGLAGAARDLGIDVEDDRLIVRREIQAEGRNRAWANGSPTTVGALAALGRLMVDLHGQHEAQSLLAAPAQRDMLDAFADAARERSRVADAHADASRLRAEEQALRQRRDDIQRRADYLRHVAGEIANAAPKPGEDEALSAEAKRLANVEEVTRLAKRVVALLEGGEEDVGAVGALGQASRAVRQLERIDESVGRWHELLDSAVATLQELVLAAQAYASELDTDPARLAAVEKRRDTLYRLGQKYGPAIEDVLRTLEEAKAELEVLDTAELDLGTLAERRAAAEEALEAAAAALTRKRRKASGALAKAVEALLLGLGMPDGRFKVDVRPAADVTSSGADQVTFLVQLNPGMEARPLIRVASGGELSRIMLALKVVLAGHDAISTLVFDEVDQGIGGEVAAMVAEALGRVAESRQVLVITHLPLIAARADHHLSVSKSPRDGVATADVTVLGAERRVQEVARMLGDADDPVAVRHAGEMLRRAGMVGGG